MCVLEGDEPNGRRVKVTTHVIPYHNLVRRVPRCAAAPDKRENITAKEHLDHSDSSAAKVAPKCLLEGLAIIDTKALVSANRKAASILIKS